MRAEPKANLERRVKCLCAATALELPSAVNARTGGRVGPRREEPRRPAPPPVVSAAPGGGGVGFPFLVNGGDAVNYIP